MSNKLSCGWRERILKTILLKTIYIASSTPKNTPSPMATTISSLLADVLRYIFGFLEAEVLLLCRYFTHLLLLIHLHLKADIKIIFVKESFF
jgi:hypothetical protein